MVLGPFAVPIGLGPCPGSRHLTVATHCPRNRCENHLKIKPCDAPPITRYTSAYGAWRSLVARVLWEH